MGAESPEFSQRVGIGYDVHRLVEGRRLVLGGVEIPHEKGLLGHSDADVLTHAAMSALLGAMAAGSLGDHFPDTDPQYENIRSIDLLERVRIMMEESGYVLSNLDTMVVCDSPRLAPHIERMRMNLSDALRVPIDRVSVKATGTEGLGFTGTGEGIAAQAICLLENPVKEEKPSKPERSRSRTKKPAKPLEPLPKIEPGRLRGCIAHVDGAVDGNPGPAGIGVVFETSKGVLIGKLSEPIGEATNNEAEYKAAIRAAQVCKAWGVEKLQIYTDSRLLARQINGSYRVKNSRILKLHQELLGLLMGFKKWRIEEVRREENDEADLLSKLALQKQER